MMCVLCHACVMWICWCVFCVRCVLGSSVTVDMCGGRVVGFGSCVWGFLWGACGTMLLEAAVRLWCVAFGMEPVGCGRAFCIVMSGYQGEFVCEERYVVDGVGSIGSDMGDGARMSPGGVVQVLLPCPIPCQFADSDSIPVSAVMGCRLCVNPRLCMYVFGAFCLHGWV